mgnify:CR=1 FL=1
MKKEFSDHLAKTFLGQKKKQKSRHHLSQRILVTCLVLVCFVLIFLLSLSIFVFFLLSFISFSDTKTFVLEFTFFC